MSETPQHSEEINQELYKRNVELAALNKTLSLLRKLYQISLLTTDPEVLTEQISKVVRMDENMEMVGVCTYNNTTDSLLSHTFSISERLQALLSSKEVKFKNFVIHDVTKKSFLYDLLSKDSHVVTSNIDDIWGENNTDEVPDFIKNHSHIETFLLYPLRTQNRFIGVLFLAFNRDYGSLSEHEQSALNSLSDVIVVALEKAYLYLDLQAANEGQINLIHIINHQVKGYLSKARNIFSEFLPPTGMFKDDVKGRAQELSGQGFEILTEGVRFVQSVLNASSIEKGTIHYDMQPFDLKPIIVEVSETMQKIAVHKGLEWSLVLPENEYKMIGDAIQLKEVFNNIFDNAIRYTKTGSIIVTVIKQKDAIICSVKDTGVGIPESDRNTLFTRGGRGKNSTRVNVDSTGYGLFFVKGVVEAHSGFVTLASDGEGKGTTCTIALPIKNS